MKKRLLSLLLVSVMAASLMTGCGEKTNNAEGSKEESKGESDAVGSDSEEKPKDIPTITFHVPLFGTVNEEGEEAVEARLNELLEEHEIDAKMDMIFESAYQEKLNMSITAREELDLLFTCNSSWALSYVDSARKGAWLELDELLEEYGQDILASYPTGIIEGAKVDGKIYAIPNYQNSVIQYNFMVQKSLADKYGLDVESISEVKDIEPFLQQIKDNEPDMLPFCYKEHIMFADFYESGYCAIPSTSNRIWVDSDYKVTFGEEIRKEFALLMLDWFEKGYIRSDIISITESTDQADKNALKYAIIDNSDLKPGYLANHLATYGVEWVGIPIMEAVQQPTGAMSAMTTVSATTKHPELCMQIINLIDTDKEFFNTICYGVDGVHCTFNDNETVTLAEDNQEYVPGANWSFGCDFNSYPTQDMEADTYDKMKAYNDEAKTSLLSGFVYDGSNTERERGNIETVLQEYAALFKGCVSRDEFEAQWERMMYLLGEAGMQIIIDDAQAQIDAWLASK